MPLFTTVPSYPPPQRSTLKGLCDICCCKDGFQGMKLLTCRGCKVSFHDRCYGFEYATPDPLCWACQSIGKTFHVRKRDVKGQRIAITQQERPTECCLCGTDNRNEFLHAMHPVYDMYGASGRQLLLAGNKSQPARLAWAHTLCCLVITSHSQTMGCVYGCARDGYFEGIEDEPERSDDETVNSVLVGPMEEDYGKLSIHHFVYVLKKKEEPDNVWTRVIQNHKKLKCSYCGKNDLPSSVYRIAIQCSANDENEYKEFQGTHTELGEDTCYVAQHVGCAVWRKNPEWPKRRRVCFFSGEHGETEAVSNVFCDVHSRDLEAASGGGSTKPQDLERRKPSITQKHASKEHGAVISETVVQCRLQRSLQPTKPAAKKTTTAVKQKTASTAAKKTAVNKSKAAAVKPKATPIETKATAALKMAATPATMSSAPPAKKLKKIETKNTKTKKKKITKKDAPTKKITKKKITKKASHQVDEVALSDSFRKSSGKAAISKKAATNKTPEAITTTAESKKRRHPLDDSESDHDPGASDDQPLPVVDGKPLIAANDKPVEIPPVKRIRTSKISESKRHKYDDTSLEKKFLEIVSDLREERKKILKEDGDASPSVLLDKNKFDIKGRLNMSLAAFTSLWDKVTQALAKDVENEKEVKKKQEELQKSVDWSHLVVGKGYKSSGMGDLFKWDSYEKLPADYLKTKERQKEKTPGTTTDALI
jgi:hypothetical protein